MSIKIISIKFLLCSLLLAHNDSYEMTFHNFLENNIGYSKFEITVIAENFEKDKYCELLFFDSETNERYYFEFNNHYSLANDSDKHYSITNWSWFNTIGIKAKDINYIWHYSPSMERGNNGKGIIEKEFFLSAIEDGYFILVYEWNWRNFDGYWKEDFDYTTITPQERVGKVKVNILNADEFKSFLETPFVNEE